MTNLDEIDRLTSPALAKEEEQARNRSNFRPPFTAVTCDTGSIIGPQERYLPNGGEIRFIELELKNMRDITGEYIGSDYLLEIRLPAKPNPHNEATLMVASSGKEGISGLQNLKGVRLEERVHEYAGNRFVASPDGKRINRDGQKGDWQDAALETRYYHVVSIGGGVAASQAPVEVPEMLAALALDVLNGKTEAQFKAAVFQDPFIKANGDGAGKAALMKAVSSGQLVKDAVAEGRVEVQADGVYTLAPVFS